MLNSRLAWKRLSSSDLTLFEVHLRRSIDNYGTKQSAINLNRTPFITDLYPELSDTARIAVQLHIFGPGAKGRTRFETKILKQARDWRMGGAALPDPPDARFHSLRTDDYALLEFEGDLPEKVSLYFITAAFDAELHARASRQWGRGNRMGLLTASEFHELVDIHEIPGDHSLGRLNLTMHKLAPQPQKQKSGRKLHVKTRKQIEEAAARQSQVGYQGETAVEAWLRTSLAGAGTVPLVFPGGTILFDAFVWRADQNAISPYDFELRLSDSERLLIDVKSTIGIHESSFYISASEIRKMADSLIPYVVFRISSLTRVSAELRVSEDMTEAARLLLNSVRFPIGFEMHSLMVSPSEFRFSEVINLNYTQADSTENGSIIRAKRAAEAESS